MCPASQPGVDLGRFVLAELVSTHGASPGRLCWEKLQPVGPVAHHPPALHSLFCDVQLPSSRSCMVFHSSHVESKAAGRKGIKFFTFSFHQ